MIKTIKTWLPLFTGFYESIFDESEAFIEYETELSESEYKEHYHELHKAGVTQEYFNYNLYDYIDYKSGNIAVCKALCAQISELDSSGIIINASFESLVSPREYNFETDSINCEIQYDAKKLSQYLRDNKEEFQKYMEEKYTSRSGFISSYPNDLKCWLDENNHNQHEVGALLEFVLLNEDSDAVLSLYEESHCSEEFNNHANIDFERMIRRFNSEKAA